MAPPPPREPQRPPSDFQHLLTEYDTPSLGKQGDTIKGKYGQSDDARKAALQDAGSSVPEVDVSQFLQSVLPVLPQGIEDNFAEIARRLKQKDGKHQPAYSNKRWTAFAQNPSKSSKKEDKVFAALVAISEAVEHAASLFAPNGVTCRFENDGSSIPTSVWRQSTTRPDGYFVLTNPVAAKTRGKYHWMDIAATGEYKKKDNIEAKNDDNLKVIWNMHHTLREDPRRRFTYAFTIEDTSLRLWYASRSEILVTQPINLMQDFEEVTRFFLAFMFSDTTSIGWDPTMQYVPSQGDKESYYTIEVHSRDTKTVTVYRTLELISDVGTNATRGRGTRVWKVCKINDPIDRTAVLKESWIDSDRDREGDILAQLRESATTASQRSLLQRCFLTVQTHGDVTIGDKADTTLSQDTRKSLAGDGSRFVLDDQDYDKLNAHIERISKTPGGTGSHTNPQEYRPKARDQPHTYRTKTRYRVVFNECCSRLSDEQSLPKILKALGTVCLALMCMHELGWVHRDVSAANILLYREPPSKTGDTKKVVVRVIVADLEYAKKIGPTRTSAPRDDVRTGTADFMAVEVFEQQYLFASVVPSNVEHNPKPDVVFDDIDIVEDDPSSPPPASVIDISYDDAQETSSTKSDDEDVRYAAQRKFFYNPLHDLESVWWIGLFFVINKNIVLELRKGYTMPSSVIEAFAAQRNRVDKQIEFSMSLFYDGTQRRSVLMSRPLFEQQLVNLHPAVRPIGQRLEEARRVLVTRYQAVEDSTNEITCSVADGLHYKLRSLFEGETNEVLPYDIKLVLLPRTPTKAKKNLVFGPVASGSHPEGSKKHMRDEDLDEESGSDMTTNPFSRPLKKPKLTHASSPPTSQSTRLTRSRSKGSLEIAGPSNTGRQTSSHSGGATKRGRGRGAARRK